VVTEVTLDWNQLLAATARSFPGHRMAVKDLSNMIVGRQARSSAEG